MKLLLLLVLILGTIACSHHHNKTQHHHHLFNKKCAYEVVQNHFDTEGKEEFKIEHGEETYYFSSAENMQKFQADIDTNIKKSKKNWEEGPFRNRDR